MYLEVYVLLNRMDINILLTASPTRGRGPHTASLMRICFFSFLDPEGFTLPRVMKSNYYYDDDEDDDDDDDYDDDYDDDDT